jgi:hypothetical protein
VDVETDADHRDAGPERIALPLPESLRGGAAAKVVGAMIAKGLLQEVDADLRKGEPMWRETGDGHGTKMSSAGKKFGDTHSLRNCRDALI